MTDDECKAEFPFYKHDIYLLAEVLDICPCITKCPNDVLVEGMETLTVIEAFCIPVSICQYGRSIRETSSTTLHDNKPLAGIFK